MKAKVFILILFLLSIANVYAEEVLNRGYIVSGAQKIPGTISVYDLSSGERKQQPVANLMHGGPIGISKVNNTKLLLGVGHHLDRWIQLIDTVSWQAEKIVRGQQPVALKGHNKFLFISERKQDGSAYLSIADMDKSPVSVRQIYEIDNYMHLYMYLQVSKDKVIASGSKGDRYNAYEIDINTLQYQPSPIGECTPYIWFESQEQLLCWEGEVKYQQFLYFIRQRATKNPFFLTKLDGSDRELWNDDHLPMDNSGAEYESEFPISYSPENDILFVARLPKFIGKAHVLYGYDMKSGKQEELLSTTAHPYDLLWIKSVDLNLNQ